MAKVILKKHLPYKTFLFIFLIFWMPFICIADNTLPPQEDVEGNTKHVVAIDPGHGGGDWGVTIRGTHEKMITLRLAALIKEKLEKSGDDIIVIMTREGDDFFRQEERVAQANTANADLYVSVHSDYLQSEEVSGYKIYSYSGTPLTESEESVKLKKWNQVQLYHIDESKRAAVYIMQYMQAALIPEESTITGEDGNDLIPIPLRGQMTARAQALTGADMPAVLIEVGNMNNKIDMAYLKDDRALDSIAYHIKEGILNYMKDRFMTGDSVYEEAQEEGGDE